MISVGWVLLVVALALLGLFLRGLVGRLDRLHLRVEASREALDAQLLRRATLVREVAEGGWLDPASALLLVDAAAVAQHAAADERQYAESALSLNLRTVMDQPEVLETVVESAVGREVMHELAGACERVILARRFMNEAVRAAREVRRIWVVRWFHLAGHAQLPSGFEMDDAPSTRVAHFAEMRP